MTLTSSRCYIEILDVSSVIWFKYLHTSEILHFSSLNCCPWSWNSAAYHFIAFYIENEIGTQNLHINPSISASSFFLKMLPTSCKPRQHIMIEYFTWKIWIWHPRFTWNSSITENQRISIFPFIAADIVCNPAAYNYREFYLENLDLAPKIYLYTLFFII